jgi:hypothetical protein
LGPSSIIIDVLQVGIVAAASCERLLKPFPLRTTRTTRTSSGPMKRPRGLWKSQRSSGKPSPSELRPEDGTPDDDGDMDTKQPTKRAKRDDSIGHDGLDVPRRVERAAADIEDWDDLKELFDDVIEKYEGAHVFSQHTYIHIFYFISIFVSSLPLFWFS